jgi:hypothetical protein
MIIITIIIITIIINYLFLYSLSLSIYIYRNRDIQVSYIPLQGNARILLNGLLHGKIISSTSHWMILEPDPSALFPGKRLLISLEKAYGYQDLWSTVFDREYLKQKLGRI